MLIFRQIVMFRPAQLLHLYMLHLKHVNRPISFLTHSLKPLLRLCLSVEERGASRSTSASASNLARTVSLETKHRFSWRGPSVKRFVVIELMSSVYKLNI